MQIPEKEEGDEIVSIKSMRTNLFNNMNSNPRQVQFLKKLPFYNLSSLYMDIMPFKLLFVPELINMLRYNCYPIECVGESGEVLLVTSGSEEQYVWKSAQRGWQCTCGRHKLHWIACRHILKCMLDREYKMLDSIHSIWHKKK